MTIEQLITMMQEAEARQIKAFNEMKDEMKMMNDRIKGMAHLIEGVERVREERRQEMLKLTDDDYAGTAENNR